MNLDELKRRQESSLIATQEREKKIAAIAGASAQTEQAFKDAKNEIISGLEARLRQLGIAFSGSATIPGGFHFTGTPYRLELKQLEVSWIDNDSNKGYVYIQGYDETGSYRVGIRDQLLKLSWEGIHSLTFMIPVEIIYRNGPDYYKSYKGSFIIWRNSAYSQRVINAAIALLNNNSIKEWDYEELRREKSNKCFIATSVYGTEQVKEIQILKKFRDEFIGINALGKIFLKSYNSWSPHLAGIIEKSPVIKALARAFLVTPAVLIAATYFKFAYRKFNH